MQARLFTNKQTPGSQEALFQLLNHKVIPSLLDVFSSIDSTSPQRLRAALGRAFKAIVSNISDCCGFQSWGILPSVPHRLWREAQFALEELFQPTALDAWLPHLLESSLYTPICGAIATGVRTPTHRTALCEWRPLSERTTRATTSKRGWEKSNASVVLSPTTPSSLHFPITHANQFWVVKHLLQAVFDRQSSLANVTVSLEALASLCKDNPAACYSLRLEASSTATETSNVLQPFLLLLQSSSQDVRIASVHLIITAAAVDCGGIQSLFSALVYKANPDGETTTNAEEVNDTGGEDDEEEEEEPLQVLQLIEAAFTCLATLGLTDGQYSRIIQELDASREPGTSSSSSHRNLRPTDETGPFLFSLLARSILHPHLGVRFSSLQLVRALTRSHSVLRTGLVDTKIPNKVVQIIARVEKESDSTKDHDPEDDDTTRTEIIEELSEGTEHRAVVIAALMSMCNLLNDYAPFREEIIQSSAIKHLVQHARSRDDDIRLNAVWALKNALFNAKHSEIVQIMHSLTWECFVKLTDDHDRRIREQSIILLQNITTTNQDLTHTVNALGRQKLVAILQQAMSNNDPKTVENAIRALNNVIAGPDLHRDLVLSQKSLLFLLKNGLTNASVGVRCAAANCVCELLARQPFRHRELRDVGMEQALKSVLGGRERSGVSNNAHGSSSQQQHGAPSASSFGAALAASGSFSTAPVQVTGATGGVGGGPPGGSTSDVIVASVQNAPGLMGKELDREVIEAVKVALALLDKGKD
ncbi:hypothetical protein FRC17_010000 [Serendipita sp. 399]|nr:hypothetical protein FRC17_010000 [Serendipita sp. 399]